MSTEYTPTTDEVRAGWMTSGPLASTVVRALEFERWLAAHDRAVKAEALREVADMLNFAPATDTRDPLEAEVRQIKMLRVLADEIEKETIDD